MTTLELKEANKKEEAQVLVVARSKDAERLQSLIEDITRRGGTGGTHQHVANLAAERIAGGDDTEIGINLEHAHDKIQAILNRAVMAISNDVSDGGNDNIIYDHS